MILEYLVYVTKVGTDKDGNNIYQFYFAEDPSKAFGENWAEQVPSIVDCKPSDDSYNDIRTIITDKEIHTANENSCFSMQDCIDGVIAAAWMEEDDGYYYPLPFAANTDAVDKFMKHFSLKFEEKDE